MWLVDVLCTICFAAMYGPLIVFCGVLIPSVVGTLFQRCCEIKGRQRRVGFFRYPVSSTYLYAAITWFVLLCLPPFLMLVQVAHTASGGWGLVPGFEYGILALGVIPFVMTALATRGFIFKREFEYWFDIFNGKLDNHSVCDEDFIIATTMELTLDAYLQERRQRGRYSLQHEIYARELSMATPHMRFSGSASGSGGGSASSTSTLTQSEDRQVQLTLRSSRSRRPRTPQPKYPCDICGKLKTLRGCRLLAIIPIVEAPVYLCNACARKPEEWRIERRTRRINEENAFCNLKPQRRLTILPRQSENS